MNFLISKFINFLISAQILLTAKFAFAQVDLSGQPGIDLTIQDVLGIITGLACWITRTALVLVVVAVVYFGVKFLTAQGDPNKLTEAKRSFLWGLVGIIVILGTYTIIATVAYNLGIKDLSLILPLTCPSF